MTENDGISGTDNVEVLFPEKPSAAPVNLQPEVIALLEQFLLDASSGRCVGVMIVALDNLGGHRNAIAGKVPFGSGVALLEQMKFGILARDYTSQLEQKAAPK